MERRKGTMCWTRGAEVMSVEVEIEGILGHGAKIFNSDGREIKQSGRVYAKEPYLIVSVYGKYPKINETEVPECGYFYQGSYRTENSPGCFPWDNIPLVDESLAPVVKWEPPQAPPEFWKSFEEIMGSSQVIPGHHNDLVWVIDQKNNKLVSSPQLPQRPAVY